MPCVAFLVTEMTCLILLSSLERRPQIMRRMHGRQRRYARGRVSPGADFPFPRPSKNQ
ncbi:hypothetical protein OF83DRAFT_1140293 [Amylostereum chailletii]|nr:hypothetical protein OF83DRAFT_1140293 [Amylostereum chailletii]